MSLANARLLIGRKIIDFIPRPFPDGRGGTTYDPMIVLDNGARLVFSVDETEGSEYGIYPQYCKAERKK